MREFDYEILLKYLDGKCTEEEEWLLNNWLELPENRLEFETMQKIWNVDAPGLSEPDVEQALESVWGKIREHVRPHVQNAEIYRLDFPTKPSFLSSFFKQTSIIKAAAAIVILFIAVYSIGRLMFTPEMVEMQVANKQIQKIILSDGSEVTLDAGSKISYPEEFSGETRTVNITGEGFFEVTHNPEKPFVVETGGTKITVLGTKFNVSNWDESNIVSVAVSEGKVSFASEESESGPVYINAGFESTLVTGEEPGEPVETDVNSITSWLNKEKTFRSVPLKEILRQLERWYDLRFVLPSDSDAEEIVTIHITNSPLNEILDLISAVMEFSYSQTGNEVRFTKK